MRLVGRKSERIDDDLFLSSPFEDFSSDVKTASRKLAVNLEGDKRNSPSLTRA